MEKPPIDAKALRIFFTEFQCPGVVALIDYLETPEGQTVCEIGSSGIDLDGVVEKAETEAEKMAAYWFRTHKLYIGSRDGSVMPLEWLNELSKVFSKVSAELRERFDRSCDMLATGATAPRGEPLSLEELDR